MFSRRPRSDADLAEDPQDSDESGVIGPTATDGATKVVARVEKKGRPTPSRKEAEAAAAARAKVPRTRKEQAAAQRVARGDQLSKVKTAMRTGDERHFLARDKGPVRRFVRDFVDSRLGFAQLLFPLMVLTIATSVVPSTAVRAAGSTLQLGIMVLTIGDLLFLRWRLGREVARRFPDASMKGLTWYAVSRSIYPKFARRGAGMVRPTVRIGEPLPERYR